MKIQARHISPDSRMTTSSLRTRRLQTLLVGYSASAGGPRARKLQRLKSSFRASSGTTRLSTVQLIQQIQVPQLLPSMLLGRTYCTEDRP